MSPESESGDCADSVAAVQKLAPFRRRETHAWLVFCVAFSADGKRLASAGDDQTVKVWDAQPRSEASTSDAKTR